MDDLNKPRPKKNATSPFQRRGFVSLPRRDFAKFRGGMFSRMLSRRAVPSNSAQAQKPQQAAVSDAAQQHKTDVKPNRSAPSARSKLAISINGIKLPTLHWPHINVPYAEKLADKHPLLRDLRVKVSMWTVAAVVVIAEIITMVQPFFLQHNAYALGAAGGLLTPVNQAMSDKLKLSAKQHAYNFNQGYSPLPKGTLGATGPQIEATANQDPAKGISVTDPQNQIDFTMTPKFSLLQGKQDGNRVVYPLAGNDGWAVYTMHAIGVKEDILLTGTPGNTTSFDYTLGLGSNLAARVQGDGSIGVYGNTLLSGNVATSDSKDAALLQKARQNAQKDTLLFSIPAPKIRGTGGKSNGVKGSYSISGDNLKVTVTGLNKAHYPITIDPSIYVTSAQQFMNGNNETNVDFDVADALIEKGPTTGARFDSWDSARNLNSAVWRQGVAVAGGFIYTVGGKQSSGGTVSYTTQGSDTFVVPTGITSITVKMWGGGSGGGGGGASGGGAGGDGGGAGFVQATLAVTAGWTMNVYVGGAGSGGTYSAGGVDAGGGGGGGGYSSLYHSGTPFAIAAGGGGGGGARNGDDGGTGGEGGGPSGGNNGGSVGNGHGGSGATTSGGGSGGSGGNNNDGDNGTSLTGGAGADGHNAGTNSTGGGAAGGLASGGAAGLENINNTRAGGGGGGAGYYGGGGGGATSSADGNAGGGGGGGANYTDPGATSVTNDVGSGTDPGNASDPDRSGAGESGTGGTPTHAGNAGAIGTVIITYGSGTSNSNNVSWAQFDTNTGAINAANPGNGTCSGWCTNTSYNLPAARSAFSLVPYNGFLYAIGGEDSGCTSGAGTGDNGVCKTVYIAKLGANGEPQLWTPNGGTPSFWYRDTDISSPRSFTNVVAYNDRMYLLGGKTSTSGTTTITNTAQVADITGTGQLGSWSTQTALPYYDYGYGAQIYNGYLYIIGGAKNASSTFSTASPTNNVYYNKINSDGTLNSWNQTSSFSGSGKTTEGGSFTSIWGGYIYVNGGCSAINSSGYCSTVDSDTQLASINADGSLDAWNTNASVSDARMGQNIVAWQNYIYEIGGCTTQNTTDGTCVVSGVDNTLNSINYGTINQDGDASTVATSATSGTAPCSGGSPYNCNLPGSVGNLLNETAIVNGYLYIMGGCTNDACTTTSTGVTYQAIGSDGSLQKPASCTGSYTDSYCVSSSSLPVGIGAGGTAVFNGNIYLIGGFTTTSNITSAYYMAPGSDGSVGTWNNVTNATLGINNADYDYVYARANPSTAGTFPGNLYVIGGCTNGGVGCSSYSQNVYKCKINPAGAPSACSTTGQQLIGTIPGGCGTGLAAMIGTVYANYIYLMGGLTPSCTDLTTARYAKFDNSNNIVTVSSGWVEGSNQTANGRRRGGGFGYNGYLYVVGGYSAGGGVLADIEFAKLNVSDGSWGPWKVSHVTINSGLGQWGLSVPVSNSYAYVIGGCTAGAAPSSCSSRTNVTQTFQIYNNDSGAPAAYSDASHTYGTNPHRIGASSTILNGYIYVAGGCTGTNDCGGLVSDVSYAAIDANGTIGSWTPGSGTHNLPTATAWGKLESAGGSLYYIGGQTGAANTTAVSTVYYTSGISSGQPTWATATKAITNTGGTAQTRTQFGAAVWNNRLYVIGGVNSSGTVQSTVLVSPQLNSGGNITTNWSSASTSFNVARSGLTVVAYANNLYVLGGFDGTNYLSDVQFAQISTSDGSVGSWTYSTSLPGAVSGADGFAVNGYIYLMGGRSASGTCNPATLVAPISANTTIATGNNPTGVGAWYQTNAAYARNRYGDAVAYSAGKAYVLGGACASTTAPAVSSVTPTPNTATGFSGNSATHNVQMPTTVAAGDLLLLFLTTDDNAPVTTAGGWTQLSSTTSGSGGVTAGVYAKIATGSEGGTSVNFATTGGSSSQIAAAQVYRVLAANWYGDITNGVSIATGSSATTTTPNPPALDPSWDTENNLWVAYAAGSMFTSASSYPAGYTTGGHTNNGTTTDGASATSGYRTVSASSEDPGTFTMGPSSQIEIPITVAIRPPLAYTGSDEVEQTTLLSQPQVAQYSIMFDTDSDVYPEKWLLNGLDNSIGAQWQLSYKSMKNISSFCLGSAMTTWGQTTNFGNVTLDQPGVYTPLDGSGTNTTCARFYDFFISIDSSQAYGYPDDVTRGPTITDLTLEFTADPSKRLMHGRTFTGGLQQPDDTPF